MKPWYAALLLLFALPGLAAPLLYGQQPAGRDPQGRPPDWLEQRTAEFASYRFQFDGAANGRQPLKMEPRSLLNWSNVERGTYAGALYLWTQGGRPELIACAYGRDQWLRHEFHSLSPEAIVARRDGRLVHRFKPGVEWRELSDAPQPAMSRALRLTQMRRQAERFRVTVVVQPPMGSKTPFEARLLNQPVYRTPDALTEDVAVFAFVQGTDPECILILEVTADRMWRYALTRQTRAGVQVELDRKLVLDLPVFWQLPPDPDSAFVEITPPEAIPRAAAPERR